MDEIATHLARCRNIIEEKLGWGESTTWQGSDFDKLSDRIFDETGVVLSSSTLKRVWGKVRYDSTPNIATLDALARFAGYESWRTFTTIQKNPVAEKQEVNEAAVIPRRSFPKLLLAVVAGAAIIIITGSMFLRKNKNVLTYTDVSFSSHPVARGVPNTVVFIYDASRSNADSVFIQQSWDKKRRFKVDKQLHEYTSTYYYPGYYSAKLILEDSIVKEHDVFIETDGWEGMIEETPIPVYLAKDLFSTQLGISQQQLDKHIKSMDREAPIFTLSNVNHTFNINTKKFRFTAEVQNTYQQHNGICQYTNVIVMGTKGVIDIPVCRPGCVGEVGLQFGTQYVDGKTHDLSGFGVDFTKPVSIAGETNGEKIKIFINDKMVYQGKFQDIGMVVGLRVRFSGTGIIYRFNCESL